MRYRTIVADPPWPHHAGTKTCGTWPPNGSNPYRTARLPYAVMQVSDIAALPVGDLAADSSALYLWTTERFLHDGYFVAESWGFRVVHVLVWSKRPKGISKSADFICSAEFVLYCKRGKPSRQRQQLGTVFEWPRSTHSQKPEHFLDLVEQVSPGPYVELFARRHRLGWDVWGDQSANTAELAVS